MRNLVRLAGGVGARLGAAALAFCVVAAPALAAGPKLATPNQKTLIETEHFGTFYLPKIVVAGKSVVATWRGPNQDGTTRTIAVSKDGGANFTYKLKPVRVSALAQIIDVAGDAAGNVYFVGTTLLPNQLVIVRTTPKFKEFSAPTYIDAGTNIVAASLAVSTDNKIFLAYQTTFSVHIRNNPSAPADQVRWAVSTDAAATFSDFVATNAKPGDFSDLGPSLLTGPNGEVYLLSQRDDTALRAPSPTDFADGSIAITRLDVDEPTTVSVTRPSTGSGRLIQVEGYIAGNGSIGLGWADVTLGLSAQIQTVRTMQVDATTGAALTAPIDLATIGSAGNFHLKRTDDGDVIAVMIGAGFDSSEREPAIIGRSSTDDGATFGPIRQVTGYPSVTTLDVTGDGHRVYGLWTDTRMVRFSGFSAKASKN